ncbi:hypothetical protein E2C01_017826 [Portunus trituberculatus]|uniref:Uncharacterized protein n=1 Tax=Portunus trituberculatus TaxID=210409 RepID=A0A5B7DST9_PORTR|nr:hypothetical protein [Portunus trituberculatus]
MTRPTCSQQTLPREVCVGHVRAARLADPYRSSCQSEEQGSLANPHRDIERMKRHEQETNKT